MHGGGTLNLFGLIDSPQPAVQVSGTRQLNALPNHPQGFNRQPHTFALSSCTISSPPSPPHTLLSHIRSDNWSLAAVVEWPEHAFPWRDISTDEIRRALTLGPGGVDLREVCRGLWGRGEGLSGGALGGALSRGDAQDPAGLIMWLD